MTTQEAATHLILINQACLPGCSVCAGAAAAPASAESIVESLGRLTAPSDPVYIGTEAFADRTVLPELIRACGERGIVPILLTRGLFAPTAEAVADALLELRSHGVFKVMLVMDREHLEAANLSELGKLIRALRRRLALLPEMLYLLRDGESVPAALLGEEELNRIMTIYPRRADSLHAFLARSGLSGVTIKPDRATSDHGSREPRIDSPAAAGLALAPYLPSFQALVIETTHFCNAACTHCYTSCGPEASRQRLTPEDVCRVLDEASTLPNLKRRCHIGGGEATIYWRELIAMLKHARARGFHNSIVTNGYWAGTPEIARRKMAELQEAGVADIEFSVDAMHQDFIKPHVVSNLIRAAKEHGIRIILRVCTTKASRADRVLAQLPAEVQDDIAVTISRVIAVGRAQEAIPPEDLWVDPGIPIGSCHQVLNLTLTPTGDVYPCCTGSELCPSLALGNVFRQSLPAMMRTLQTNFLVRTLVHAGPAYFAALIQESDLAHKLFPGYSSYCHLCNQIFTDPELTQVVMEKLGQRVQEQLVSLLKLSPIPTVIPTSDVVMGV